MNWRDHIHSDPAVLGGKPVIRGTRISVELVLEYFADGGSVADVLAAYAHVTEEAGPRRTFVRKLTYRATR